MKFTKKSHKGLAIFGIVNGPVVVDSAVSGQFKHLIYFELPDENTVTEILQHHGIPHAKEIARKLATNPVDARELIYGINDAIQYLGNGDCKNLKGVDVEGLADFIGNYLKMSWQKVLEYEDTNSFYIKKAEKHLAFWNSRKDNLIRL